MSLFDDASLVLIPDGAKDGTLYSVKPTDGSGDFTFTRGSNLAATRVDENGLIEKGRENLILQSNQFDTTWTTTNASVTSGQSGYDGSSDAWLLTATSSGANIYQLNSSTGVLSLSVYAKANTANWIRLRFDNSPSADVNTWVNLSNGSIGSDGGIATNVEDIGGGWYRITSQANTSDLNNVRIYPADSDGGDSTSGSIYIQDAQLEYGLVATDYIETTTTSAQAGILEDLPRIDYSGGASCPALLLEPQRTNVVPISEGIPEDEVGLTLTENYGASPEGVQNSLKVQKQGVTQNERVHPIQNYNATLVSGSDYTISAFVKNIDVTGVTTIACRVSGGTLFRQPYQWSGASLTTSTYNQFGTRTNTILEDYGNGWWRIGFTFEADGTSGNFEIDIDRDNGNDTTSIETWGWQLEAGSYPTSYIPTYGSSVTRAFDNAGTRTDMQDFLGVDEGTWFTHLKDMYFDTTGTSVGSFTLRETPSLQIEIMQDGNFFYKVSINNSTAVQDLDGEDKLAIAWSTSGLVIYVNGSSVYSTASSAYASAYSTLYLPDSTRPPRVDLKSMIFFPTRLSNTELAALTTI